MIIKWKVYFWFYRSAKRKFYGRVQNLLFGYIDIENIKGAIYEHFFSVWFAHTTSTCWASLTIHSRAKGTNLAKKIDFYYYYIALTNLLYLLFFISFHELF